MPLARIYRVALGEFEADLVTRLLAGWGCSDADGAISDRPYPSSGADSGAGKESDEEYRPRAHGRGSGRGYYKRRTCDAFGGGPTESREGASRVGHCIAPRGRG